MASISPTRKTFISLAAYIAFALVVSETIAQVETGKAVNFTSDGAWCWFQDPRAVYVKGAHERVYAQWMTSKGELQVGALDLESGEKGVYTLGSVY